MVRVRVCRDEILAVGEGKVHLTNQIDDFIDGVSVTDIQQHPVAAGKNQIHTASQSTSRLKVEFNYVWKKLTPFEHWGRSHVLNRGLAAAKSHFGSPLLILGKPLGPGNAPFRSSRGNEHFHDEPDLGGFSVVKAVPGE
jgi:hypothetical protein